MQELAPKGTDSPIGSRGPSGNLPTYTGGHPSAEMLAAYIDQVLDPVEAEQVTAHLADCEDCYAVYSESLQFLLEAGPEEGEEGKVVPFPPRPPKIDPRPWLQPWHQIAALLLVGVGTGSYFYLLHTPPTLKTEVVAAPLPTDRPEIFNEDGGIWTGPRFRGEGEVDIPLDEAAFRTGVQLVNLQVSLKAGEVLQAQDSISEIYKILDEGYGTKELQDKYQGLTGSLEDAQTLSTFLPEATQLAKETREIFAGDETSLDLGQWVEAARLAAATRDPRFFQQGDTKRFLRRLLWRDKVGRVIWTPWEDLTLSETTRKSLQEVSRILSKGDLQPSDYSKLTDALGQVLEEHYPET